MQRISLRSHSRSPIPAATRCQLHLFWCNWEPDVERTFNPSTRRQWIPEFKGSLFYRASSRTVRNEIKWKLKRCVTDKNCGRYEKKWVFNVIRRLDQSLQKLFLHHKNNSHFLHTAVLPWWDRCVFHKIISGAGIPNHFPGNLQHYTPPRRAGVEVSAYVLLVA